MDVPRVGDGQRGSHPSQDLHGGATCRAPTPHPMVPPTPLSDTMPPTPSQELAMAKGGPVLLKISMEEPLVGLQALILWPSQRGGMSLWGPIVV